jgi:nitroreductase
MTSLSLSWYQALFIRSSRRSFHHRPVEEDKLARLERLCRDFRPHPGVRTELVRRPPEAVFRGIIGSYGRISGARAYFAFLGEPGRPRTDEWIGYMGEGLILEATILGLATCWVSGFFRPEAVREELGLGPEDRVYAVSPLGYAERGRTIKEKIYSGLAGSSKRKPLAELISGAEPRPWQTQAVAAARLAPSATNRQPWRFILGPESIAVEATGAKDASRFPKRLDCGIAMLHLELGALAAGVKGEWVPLEAPAVARFERRS